jgi:hypothetical protein
MGAEERLVIAGKNKMYPFHALATLYRGSSFLTTIKVDTMFYQKNLPLWERVLRVCLALLTAAFGASLAPGPLVAWLAYGSALTLALTGFLGFCPMCALAGRRAEPVK